jgi:hypothetical protein
MTSWCLEAINKIRGVLHFTTFYPTIFLLPLYYASVFSLPAPGPLGTTTKTRGCTSFFAVVLGLLKRNEYEMLVASTGYMAVLAVFFIQN